jgi:FkbM family methyltransferase
MNTALKNLTSIRLHPSGTFRIKIDDSISFKMSANQTSYVHKLLYWNGPVKFEYTPIFIELIKHCKVFLDVGANSGYYSLLASAINKNVTVHAFEPALGPSYYLQKNIRDNKPNQIRSHSEALSSKVGHAKFYNVRNAKYANLKYNLSGTSSLVEDENKQSYEVTTTTIDEFSRLNLSSLDLIKIDTEGTEDLILRGATDTIRKYRPIIICEILFNNIENNIEQILLKADYVFFGYRNGNLYKLDSLIRKNDDGIRDCFCVHSTKENYFKKTLRKYLTN